MTEAVLGRSKKSRIESSERGVHVKTTGLLILGLIAFGCAESSNILFHKPHSRGNESFKNSLALGAGSFRSPVLKANHSLNLADTDIVSQKIDPASGAWASVTYDTRKSAAFPAGSDPIAAARELIEKHAADLGFNADEIVMQGSQASEPFPGSLLVVFQRAYNGLAIKGAFIQIYFAKQGDGSLRLSEIVNNSFGPIAIKPEVDASPSDEEVLVASGLEDGDAVKVEGRELLIQPSVGPDGRYEFTYATEYKISDAASGELYSLTLNNADLSIVEAYSNHVYERQQISAETFVRSYVLQDQAVRPLQFANILDNGQKLITDENGFVDVTGPNVTVQLVSDKSAGGIQLSGSNDFFSFPLRLGANGQTSILLNSTDAAAINTFVAMQEVTNYVGRFLSPEQFRLLSQGIRATVNLPENCNAFYNGQSLNFFSQGNGCANTGLVSDIVYHEWGHAMDDFLGTRNRSKNQSGITDGAFSEGIGDILSAYMNRSPNLAPGFFLNSNRALRTVKNQRRHPPANAQEAEVHSAGLIVGGAFWDLFEGMSTMLGPDEGQEAATRLFLNHMTVTDRYTDSYQSVLRVDDNDNNPATPSPHKCLITRAFAAHGLSGGDSVGADCVDTDSSLNVRVDVEEADGQLSLLVSAGGASRVIACEGAVKRCDRNSNGFVEFGDVGSIKARTVAQGGRKFFEARGTVQAKDDGVFTIISMDATDKILGVKTLTFKPRDRSGDLSQQGAGLR